MNPAVRFFTFLSIACLNAQETDSVIVDYTFKPIVKIATRTAGVQRDLAASISVIQPQEIEESGTSQVFTLAGQTVPGMYTTEWGVKGFGVAGKAAGKISMRGMGGGANTHILILRNGRPDFMGLMGCTIADEFSTIGVDHIEIIRGPGSFLYGTNATGGVINIVSKKLRKPGFETRVQSGTGSYGSYEYSFGHGGNSGLFDYYLTGSRELTDGHRSDGNASYKGNHATAHLGYQAGPRTSIELNASLADIRLYDPGLVSDPRTGDWYELDRYGGDLTLVHSGRWGESNLKVHGNFGHHSFFDGWVSNDRLIGIMAYQTLIPWTGQTLTGGFDLKEYGGNALDASMDYKPYYLTEYAPYLHSQQLIGRRLILTAGLRMEHHDLYGWEMLPKAGIVFHLSNSNSLRFSAARGFRSPSIRELYFWKPANDDLTPDRVLNLELGVDQSIGHSLKIDAVVFQAEGSNLIQFSGPPPEWVNGGEYTHRGFEITAGWMPVESLRVDGTYTFTGVEKEVYNVPGKKATLHARYSRGRFWVTGQLIVVTDLMGADASGSSPVPVLHEMDDYRVLDCSAQVRLFGGLKVRAALNNALDEQYESMVGYPMPGRSVRAMMIVDF